MTHACMYKKGEYDVNDQNVDLVENPNVNQRQPDIYGQKISILFDSYQICPMAYGGGAWPYLQARVVILI